MSLFDDIDLLRENVQGTSAVAVVARIEENLIKDGYKRNGTPIGTSVAPETEDPKNTGSKPEVDQ